ncbi:hypothetical protein C8A01DRAFT_36432 [Parachaetomium inaequale]|uniref:Kelch repeat protein n=1 Tax=Parachaetomium inaequale TaxID=2588326 RepID=A0AAN6PEQ0_9PEZI|nr:hypothetical protein C8A01DRAFT_36432 [Parachaetomium inaequale]
MRSYHTASSLLALLGGFQYALGEELSDAPPAKDFLRRAGASPTLIGNYVYFDGGEISQLLDGKTLKESKRSSNAVNSTISIDMSKSWTASEVTLRTIERPWPSKSNQALWTDQETGTFWVWGGKWIGGKNMVPNEIWKFTTDGNGGGRWAKEIPANPGLFNDLEQYEHGAWANTATTGFSIGGMASGWTKKYRGGNQVIPGMVAFNMKTKVFQNGTTAFSPFDTLAAASAQFVPTFGANGLVMVFGGLALPVASEPKWETGIPYDLRNLTFFDPETKDAYWQIASGTIPPSPRSQFCVAGFENSDGGYEILLSGGYNHRDKYYYGDSYILSLPGFVWTRVPDSPAGNRAYHHCVSVGKRQVLSIGGTKGPGWDDADLAPQGLTLFDMTDLKWKDSYDADAAAYERAPDIKTWYTNGSFDAVEWSSDSVQRLFVTKSTTDSQDPAQDPGSSTTSTPSPSASVKPESSTPVAAIAGGVVGGVAGIALIGAVAWLLLRRRRNRNATPGPFPGSEDAYSDGHYAPEVVKANPTVTPGASPLGFKTGVVELTSQPSHAELDVGATPTNPLLHYSAPVEMDATPIRY